MLIILPVCLGSPCGLHGEGASPGVSCEPVFLLGNKCITPFLYGSRCGSMCLGPFPETSYAICTAERINTAGLRLHSQKICLQDYLAGFWEFDFWSEFLPP